jgi:hypothetical protein
MFQNLKYPGTIRAQQGIKTMKRNLKILLSSTLIIFCSASFAGQDTAQGIAVAKPIPIASYSSYNATTTPTKQALEKYDNAGQVNSNYISQQSQTQPMSRKQKFENLILKLKAAAKAGGAKPMSPQSRAIFNASTAAAIKSIKQAEKNPNITIKQASLTALGIGLAGVMKAGSIQARQNSSFHKTQNSAPANVESSNDQY